MHMNAGKYWVGDLCYVLHNRWDEFCELTIRDSECLNGEFEFKDGIRFATQGTFYGDGEYTDEKGRSYSVDAGIIGCINVEHIETESNLGHIMEFDEDFVTESENGIIRFVGVSGKPLLEIDTSYSIDEDEDTWDGDDEDNWDLF